MITVKKKKINRDSNEVIWKAILFMNLRLKLT